MNRKKHQKTHKNNNSTPEKFELAVKGWMTKCALSLEYYV